MGELSNPDIVQTTNLEIRHWLGRELALVVYDCWQGLDPDALAAICGCIRSGGCLLLLVPDLSAWPALPDPYLKRICTGEERGHSGFVARLVRLLQESSEVEILRPGTALSLETAPWVRPAERRLTPDQAAALRAIVHHSRESRGRVRPLLITADRGRGKSSLLGHAAAVLLDQGLAACRTWSVESEHRPQPSISQDQFLPNLQPNSPAIGQKYGEKCAAAVDLQPTTSKSDRLPRPVLVSAAHPQMLEAVFAEVRRCLPEVQPDKSGALALSWLGQWLRFMPVDELLRQRHQCRWLLVDEAAAIPLPLLEALARDYPSSVFASTTQGYEGSGRGFVLRFGQRLDALYPGWQQLELHTAVRWARDDPLEQLLYRLLLLDAEPKTPAVVPGPLHMERLDTKALVSNEPLLRQVFGLLRATHYQTRPSDLRRLLDQPGLVVLVLMEAEVVIGIVLAIAEGGFDAELAGQIQRGLRRPRGHLLPQSLCTHAGLEGAARLSYLRISRIAIHPERQRQGLGSLLLQRLADCGQGVDFLGASFAASPELIAFWYRNSYWPLRLGYRREAASGQHSLQLLKPLSPAAQALWPQWRRRFDEQFPYLLGDPLRHLEPTIAALLLYPQGGAASLDAQDNADLNAFAQGRRDYGGARLALWRLLCLCAHKSDPIRIEALILKVLQTHDWPLCAQRLGLAGRKAVMERMRQEARDLLDRCP